MIYLVTIQDKMLYGEPDVALAVVEAADEEAACHAARAQIVELAEGGRGRCVPHARQLEPGKFYRLGAVVRLPRDPDAEERQWTLEEKSALARTAMSEYPDRIPTWIGELASRYAPNFHVHDRLRHEGLIVFSPRDCGWRLTGAGWQALNACKEVAR